MTLLIVRHGRTKANAARLLLGRMDVPLDELGRAQADALAAAIGPVDRVICSPLSRTRETAERIRRVAADREAGPLEVDERFIELDYGEYDGVGLDELPASVWDAWRRDPAFVPPGGESLQALRQRVETALIDLAEDAINRTVVVVTHVSPIKAAVAWALGVDDHVVWRLFVSPASISRIMVADRGPVLQSFNDVAHLRDLEA
jgi:broad specificity phosphatase PhoE